MQARNEAAAAAVKEQAGQLAEKIKGIPKVVLGCIGGGAAVFFILLFFLIKSGSTINLDKYVTFETEGYNGYGRVGYEIDWKAIEKKYGKKIRFTKDAMQGYGVFLEEYSPVDALKDYVDLELSVSSGLSNGDEVEYFWDVDDSVYEVLKCKLKFSEDVYVVEGLEEVGTFDAFADLEVTFEGTAPFGQAELNYNGSRLSSYDFSCENTSDLSNGDTITVTIDENVVDFCVQEYGEAPQELSKTYTVDSLNAYVTKLADIDPTGLELMKNQGRDIFQAYVARDWSKDCTLNKIDYVGEYLLTQKEPDGNRSVKNSIILVYKPQIHVHYETGGNVFDQVEDFFWYVSFDNLKVTADGELVADLSEYDRPSASFDIKFKTGPWSSKSYRVKGCQTLDGVYTETVMVNLDAYNHEDHVDENASVSVSGSAPEGSTAVPAGNSAAGNSVHQTGYVLPNSDKMLITKEELKNFTAEDCKRARNEIYARHGRKFKDQALQDYFNSCDWYQGTIEPDQFPESLLSEIEIANRNLIVEYEKEKGFS